MQALFIEKKQLVLRECAAPTPEAGEVLIKVAYAGLNRADLFQREGTYPIDEAYPVSGLEVSGHIAALGQGVSRWREGDAVCALLAGGGYGDYAIAKAEHCLSIPSPLSLEQAAAIPECAATVQMSIFNDAGLKRGEAVLVQGGASGVGTTAIQMLRACGCEVFATAGTPEKVALCEQLGAHGIHYKTQDFAAMIKEAGGIDAALDIVGGEAINRILSCLKVGGRLVSIAFLTGNQPQISAGRLLMKRLHWMGATLRARSDGEKARYLRQLEQYVWPQIAAGQFVPVIDSVYPLAQAAKAQEKMQNYLHCGKIILKVCEDNE